MLCVWVGFGWFGVRRGLAVGLGEFGWFGLNVLFWILFCCFVWFCFCGGVWLGWFWCLRGL